MDFEWDENKNQQNIKKHKVRFEDAIPVFFDENAVSFEDNRYNYPDGQRMVIIGANNANVLYVAYAELEADTVRIISVRPADSNDIRIYRRGY